MSPFEKLVIQTLKDLGIDTDKLPRKKEEAEIFPNRIWDEGEDLLRVFFDLLKDDRYRLIDKSEDWDNFKIVFLTGKVAKPIRWLGTIVQLVCIIDRLRDMGDLEGKSIIMPNDQPHKLLQLHFRNKNGKELELTVLRSSLEKGVRNEEHLKRMEEIINKIDREWAMGKIEDENSSTP